MPEQARPQLPQLRPSTSRSTHPSGHNVAPSKQAPKDWQNPLLQDSVDAQKRPQAPQLNGSKVRSAQPFGQGWALPTHSHFPAMHELNALQARLQAPQWTGLADRSKHDPLHSVRPPVQGAPSNAS
jgi:hypothetical protein